MSFMNYRKDAECTREITTTTLKAGVDCLRDPGGDSELRDNLAENMKNLLDENAKLEAMNSEFEFVAGQFTGIWIGGMSVLAGFAVGEAIKKFFMRR